MRRKLLTTSAVLEAATGLGIVALPSLAASLMLGSPLETPAAVAVARIAGTALLALGVDCWQARDEEGSAAAKGLVVALLVYNVGVIAILVREALAARAGIALWPTVVLHAAMAFWCVTRR